jgi:ribulose-5-phosphate 4-epimerase/fuculose-1-phosphate aldolase
MTSHDPGTIRSQAMAELATANRVLVMRGVLDAFGHISVRDPEQPDHFLISRNLAPAAVTAKDIQLYDFDGRTADERPGYLERFLHAEIYRLLPAVRSVVHSHSPSMLPFSVSSMPLRAVSHMAGFLAPEVPVFEIRDVAGDASDLLIRNGELGQALAGVLGQSAVALMRGHGWVAVGQSVPHAVFRAVFAEANAKAQAAAVQLGEITALTDAEAIASAVANHGQISRAWALWSQEVAIAREQNDAQRSAR